MPSIGLGSGMASYLLRPMMTGTPVPVNFGSEWVGRHMDCDEASTAFAVLSYGTKRICKWNTPWFLFILGGDEDDWQGRRFRWINQVRMGWCKLRFA